MLGDVQSQLHCLNFGPKGHTNGRILIWHTVYGIEYGIEYVVYSTCYISISKDPTSHGS